MNRVHLLALLLSSTALAATPDRVGAPYFMVEGADGAVDRLPLKSTDVDVNVVGVIAEVRVRQVYVNEGTRPLNTRYVFPGSTRSAVHGLVMRVGERQVRAQIREKELAQRQFDQAKAEGKTASLLTEERPNVFTMNLANVLPKDRIEVQLQYSELLVPENGAYELTFPAVVGPRYVSPTSTPEAFSATPIAPPGKEPQVPFTLRARIVAGTPVTEVTSSSHVVHAQADVTGATTVSFSDATLTRDFVLRYRLTGKAVASGLLLSEPVDGEGAFLLTVEPPARINPEAIPPRDYLFIVDVSGSMLGFPLTTAKHLVTALTRQLRPTDTFNILFFSGGDRTLAERSLPATPANLQRATTMLSQVDGGGGTELLPALRHAFSLPHPQGVSRSVVVITDGYVTVEREALEFISGNLGDSNVFAFGIGSSVNRYLIEGMARAGHGVPFIVTSEAEADATAESLSAYIRAPVLTHVRVAVDGFAAHDLEPAALPDVLADRPVVVQGRYSGAPKGTITVSGVSGTGPWSKTFDVSKVAARPEHAALRTLWARERIATLSDYATTGAITAEEQGEVTRLGLEYELLTRYTSFVAVLDEVRAHGDPTLDVAQPLPLPDGVSEEAVGGHTGAEPEFFLVCALAVAALVVALRRRPSSMAAASP